jgi:arrestin-related trafficking adapter 9
MSVDPCRQSPTLPPSKTRSVISRVAAHFGNRTRNISEFYIQPDDPWRTYFTGDAIKGTVVLTIVKPLRITHLVICLHAYVKIFKNTIAPGEAGLDIGFLGPGRGRRGSEYLGNGFATLFEDETVLCGDGRLKEGMYKFQFVMELPPYSLPSSINVCYYQPFFFLFFLF